MPGMDGTGPAGHSPMSGGRRGRCVTDDAQIARTAGPGPGRGMGYGRGAGLGHGGHGRRNQYYATGLTGRQRTEMAGATAVAAPQADRLERVEAKLTEALARLSRLEGVE
jgi:hypothetical protein